VIRTKARACDGKLKHASREDAEAHRRRLIRVGASPAVLAVYACPTVKPGQVRHFHIGSMSAEERKAKRRRLAKARLRGAS
jgi:hypothetical protein